jgi:hypothetical protein
MQICSQPIFYASCINGSLPTAGPALASLFITVLRKTTDPSEKFAPARHKIIVRHFPFD